MHKYFIFSVLAAAALTLLLPSPVNAISYSYQLSDGLAVTMEVQPAQTVLTLQGQPYATYQIDATETFNGWTTLASAALDGTGSFVHVDTSNLSKCFYRVSSAVTFVSLAAEDGRIADTPANPGTGTSVNAIDTGPSALRAGDISGAEKENRTFLSFDTSYIPDGAAIVGATLRLRRGAVSGTNPFLTHGTCWIDIKGGSGFSDSTALLGPDFQAPADAAQVGSLSNAANDGDWSVSSLNAAGRQLINKAGTTQFRVYFTIHDNEDDKADYIGWYSGENATPANRPVLEVLYR